MTASALELFLPVLSAFVGAIIGALANGRYRDRQDRRAEDREAKGLLMLTDIEIHDNGEKVSAAIAPRGCYDLDRERLVNAENGGLRGTEPTGECASQCGFRPSS